MSRSRRLLSLLAILSLPASAAFAQSVCPTVQWTSEGQVLGDQFGRVVAFVDANHDLYSDLLVGSPGSASVKLYTGTGAPSPNLFGPPQTFTGAAGSQFGISIAVGDFNDDGRADFAVGAPLDVPPGSSGEGSVFIFLGGPSGFSPTPAYTVTGLTGSSFGASLCAGDIDGDGAAELVIGAPNENGQGGIHLYKITAGLLSAVGHKDGPQPGSLFGSSVTVGDMNGDHVRDIAVGAPGAGLVEEFNCSASPPLLPTTISSTIQGEAPGDQFGAAVCGVANIDGDVNGRDDLLVGAPIHAGVGRAYLFPGNALGVSTAAAWSADGDQSGGKFGSRLATADVTGDGRPDILASAPGAGLGGRVTLFASAMTGVPSATPSQQFEGEQSGSNFGLGLAAGGDINGDGREDLVVGAPTFTGLASSTGKAYALLGGSCDNPVPALATWIESEPIDGGVRLAWYAQGQSLVEVDRRTPATDWHSIGWATPGGADRLTYEDHQVVPGQRYGYRIEIAGAAYGEAWVTMTSPSLALTGFPTNPGNSRPTISFRLASSESARLEVLDLKGRFMYRRDVGSLGSGDHTVVWEGASLGPGVYWIQLQQGTTTRRVKGIVLP